MDSILNVQHAGCVACPKCFAARLVKLLVSLSIGYEHKLLIAEQNNCNIKP